MLVRPRTIVPLALALLACRPDAASHHASEPAPPQAAPQAEAAPLEQPSHLLLPWETALLTRPHADASALRLGLAEDNSAGRAVAVVGREGDFWQVETLDAVALSEFEAQPIEGLDYYRLRLYVPIGVGRALRPIPPGPDDAVESVEPAPDADMSDAERARARALAEAQQVGILGTLMMSSNPPVQTGESRPSGSETDFRVGPSTPVFWPDGQPAGEVRLEHAFVQAGAPVWSESGELRCFEIRVGPAYEVGDGELCFTAETVREVAFVPEADAFAAWGDIDSGIDEDVLGGLVGAEIGEDWDYGGLGMTGSGMGGGGTGEGMAIGNVGTIGLGSGGGGSGYGSGYGSGSQGGLATLSGTKVATLSATDAMDGETGGIVVRAQLTDLDMCWAANLGDGKEREVQLTLQVDTHGNVLSSKAKSKRPALDDCIEDVSATWLFPSSNEGKLVVRISF